jgi:uncharacterized membrane protein YeiB
VPGAGRSCAAGSRCTAAGCCSTRSGITVGAAAAFAGAALAWWRLERRLDGHSTAWLDHPGAYSPRGLLLGVLVNGTHPLLPWLAFFCAGIVLGRALWRPVWRPLAILGGLQLFVVATLVGAAIRAGDHAPLASTHPYGRGLVYTAAALGIALAAFGIGSWLAERYSSAVAIRWLADAGAMSLTLYVLHALAFDLLVNRLHWIRPTGLDTALAFSAVYWIAGIAAAGWWHRRHGIGPCEWLYRRLGG